MKHLKNFSLFESKSHKLSLPKDQAELDVLSEFSWISEVEKFKGKKWWMPISNNKKWWCRNNIPSKV